MFSNEERMIYAKRQLVEVICQLRFPEILSIDASEPAAFQDRIRKPPAIDFETEASAQYPPLRQVIAKALAERILASPPGCGENCSKNGGSAI